MKLTHHPFQVIGARAAAAMIGRDDPADLTDTDLDRLVDNITRDAAIAGLADTDGPGYGWWLVLAAAYPNSAPVHPSRARWTDLEDRVRGQFAPDTAILGPCSMCAQPAGVRWGKAHLPLAESLRYATAGALVCRPCRIALWCLPYGSMHSRAFLYTVTSESPELERAIVAANVDRSRRMIAERWPGIANAPAWDVTHRLLIAHPAQMEIRRWRNDNRDPSLTESVIAAPAARWLAGVDTDPLRKRGLEMLCEAEGTHPIRLVAGDAERSVVSTAGAAIRRHLDGAQDMSAAVGDVAPMARLAMSIAAEAGV